MDASPAPPAAPPDGGGAARMGALAWILIVGVALACRLWRFEAVGEGVDEGVSVTTTRAMLDGKFSFARNAVFVRDAFAARFQPVAEAIAVPFVLVLGDRPLAYRLPWLIASLALLVLLVRHAERRFGRTSALVLGALYALDYRNVYYSQTHRYAIATQLFGFLAYLAAARAIRVSRRTAWIPVVLLSLLLLHSHLMGAWVLLGFFLAAVASRRWTWSVLFAAVLAYVAAMLLLLRSSAGPEFYAASDADIAAAVVRSANWTVRMIAGLGIVAGPLAILGVLLLVRRRTFEDRAPALMVLAAFALWLPAGAFVELEPRYATCLQPFVFLAAAVAGGAIVDRLRPRPAARGALAALALVATAAPTAWYLATGGVRDVEAPLLAALSERARPGDVVVYDVPGEDVFHRRPSNLEFWPIRRFAWYEKKGRLDEARVRWFVRSASPPLHPSPFASSLELVATSTARGFLQEPLRLTLYRVRP